MTSDAMKQMLERLRQRASQSAVEREAALPGGVVSAEPESAGAPTNTGEAGAGARPTTNGGRVPHGANPQAAERILEGLNPQQRAAVVHDGGPLLVVAGAGSGKTRVLTSRIAYLIATGRARPAEVLAITFTNKAAREMRDRLGGMLGGLVRSMWISTFHSACLRILRAEHKALGMRSTFTIYDAQDSQRLMNMVTREQNIDVRAYPAKSLTRQVSDLKNELVTPLDQGRRAQDQAGQVLAQAYGAYQEHLQRANAMDFDDLIMRTVRLFQEHPDIAARYRGRFRHILVDEYQDTNHAQYVLIRTLTGAEDAEDRAHLTVVGDADQSIYAFRGATIRNIEHFEEDFPDSTTILLEQNYRSTQSILSAANAVIAHNQHRRAKNLWSDRGQGEKLVGYVADSEADEANFVTTEIDALRDEHGYKYGDVAVFYRTNAQSRALEDQFVRSGIPYRVIGGTKFYERREIKDALAYLHSIVNPDDAVSLRRILNVPKRGIGAKSEEHVVMHAAKWNISFGLAMWDVAHPAERGEVEGLTKRARASMGELVEALHASRELAESGAAPADVLDKILDESGYLEELLNSEDPQDEARVDNLAELHSVAVDFHTQEPDAGLAEWLDRIALVADSDKLPDGEEGEGEVTLMTVHTAKGLEFPVVFVTGLEDGTFPHMRSLGDPRELAEERRLAYVALTRARERLYVTRAATRASWGAPQEFPASRFLTEIPPELIDWRREESSADLLRASGGFGGWGSRHSAGSGYSGGSSYSRRFDDDAFADAPVLGSGKGFKAGKLGVSTTEPEPDDPPSSTATEPAGIAVGDKVRHKSFGVGTVLSFEGKGKSAVAKVAFSNGQTKRLMLRFAPLEKVE